MKFFLSGPSIRRQVNLKQQELICCFIFNLSYLLNIINFLLIRWLIIINQGWYCKIMIEASETNMSEMSVLLVFIKYY